MKEQGKKILILIGGMVSIFIILFILSNIFSVTNRKISYNMQDESIYRNESPNTIVSEEDNTINCEIKEVKNEKEFESKREEDKEQKKTGDNKEKDIQKQENETSNITNDKKQINTSVVKKNDTDNKNQILNSIETKKENTDKEREDIVENSKKEESIVKTEKPIEIPKDQHSYKYNEAMVEKIKNDIKNNESIYMQQYGYEIIVDESIIEQTNQFTYTQSRVKTMIRNKCGTIKIYARDYYYNDSYQYTEAYIL